MNAEAANRVREAGEWIADHAADIVGSYPNIEAGGLTVSFTLEHDWIKPKVEVRRTHLIW